MKAVTGEPVGKVYPSPDTTVWASDNDDLYGKGGAHLYTFQNCLGFSNGETQYDNSWQQVQFVKKADDGTVTPGLQSEQLVIALMDRLAKMNARFPSDNNERALAHLQGFLDCCKERIDDRISRGVMGDLKK